MSGAFGAGAGSAPPVGGPCPCGSGEAYAACCGPFLDGTPAPTAEALMRSRYTAFARNDIAYLVRTWHPRTRPEGLREDTGNRWVALRVIDTLDGGPDDETGEVEFEADWLEGAPSGGGRRQRMHERSRFVRRGGRWVYLDGDQLD
ncbi:YchJ family protein [Actinomycetota bacterium]